GPLCGVPRASAAMTLRQRAGQRTRNQRPQLLCSPHRRFNEATMTHHSLKHLRVAVTGGTSGLGLALVRALHARGAQVAFVARDAQRVQRVANELPDAHGIVGDIADKDDTHRIALQINAALGGLDVLVNNASSLGPTALQLLADTDCEDLEAALATN